MIFKHGEDGKIVYYERKGECRHCGGCCDLHCKQFRWTTLRNIKEGETIEAGTDKGAIRSSCLLFYSTDTERGCNPHVREGYPFSPFSTLPVCGFYWVKLEGV